MLGLSWWVWGLLALGVAVGFAFFVPKSEEINQTTGLQFIVLRWFHSLVWVLLAISCFMRASQVIQLVGLAIPTAALGGIVYVVFVANFIRLK